MTSGETPVRLKTVRTNPAMPLAASMSPEQTAAPFAAGSSVASRVGPISPVLPPAFAIAEMAVLVTLILLEYFWEPFPDLTRINPHPYWIAVLLLSLQYGTVSGLIAASIAIIGTVLIGMPEPDIEERYFNYLIRVWTQPVLWLLVAMLLGTFRARQIEQRDELLERAENLRVRGATLLDHATNLRARCGMLERRLAMRETTETGQLLASLARLSDVEPGRWAQALSTTLDAGFPKAQISLYVVDGGVVRLVLTHHRSGGIEMGDAPVATELEPDHPLLETVVAEGRSVSVVEPEHDAALRGVGVAAVPIFAIGKESAQRRVIGMLKADMMPASQIDGSTTRRLSVIAAYLAPALQRGLVSPVAGIGAASETQSAAGRSARTHRVDAGNETIPSVRRWRLMNWLPGGRAQTAAKPDGKDE